MRTSFRNTVYLTIIMRKLGKNLSKTAQKLHINKLTNLPKSSIIFSKAKCGIPPGIMGTGTIHSTFGTARGYLTALFSPAVPESGDGRYTAMPF